jgi:leucyl-tRNA synthetase
MLIPLVPHLAHECLKLLKATDLDKWPQINNKLVLNEQVKIAIQINGKTREIIEVKKDLDEKNAIIESKKNIKINNNLENKKIVKTIFVKNKIINYLIK